MQAPSKCAGTGGFKRAFLLAPGIINSAMALWGDRIAFTDVDSGTVAVFDLAGVHLHRFGKHGTDPGEFLNPTALCAHPNGNLLVLEGWTRVQEVTWTGDHVRFICDKKTHGWYPCGVDVSPDGTLIALVAYADGDRTVTVELLDGRTCAPVKRLGIAGTPSALHALRFSPDGGRLVVGAYNRSPTMFSVHANEDGDGGGAVFGAAAVHRHNVEFTDEGDVVIATHAGATVYSGTTLEPVRSWAWQASVWWIKAIQAHRGLLYVLCLLKPDCNAQEVHVYE